MSSPEALEGSPFHDSAHLLLDVARASIEHGLRAGVPCDVDPRDYPPALREPGACFVTLRKRGELRGCVGSLEPRRPLVADVARNAFAAANRDPRFPPLAPSEREAVELHVSVLGAMEPVACPSRAALLGALEPGVHGLSIGWGTCRATFLPQVWEQLPDPEAFLARLLEKTGIPIGAPWAEIEASRYTVTDIEGPLVAHRA